jgi:hypothetical protein
MTRLSRARRFDRLPPAEVGELEVPVATGLRARLLGLAHLEREEAGAGLLIPRCRGVHTFGMRFALDLVFLDRSGRPLAVRRAVGPRRIVGDRSAASFLELPAPSGYFCDLARVPSFLRPLRLQGPLPLPQQVQRHALRERHNGHGFFLSRESYRVF